MLTNSRRNQSAGLRCAPLLLALAGLIQTDLTTALQAAGPQVDATSSGPPVPRARCAEKSTCRTARAPVGLESFGPDKPACRCDRNCALYDDCCHDALWAEAATQRRQLGAPKLRARRREWLCRRADPTRPAVYLRATCHPSWANGSQRADSAVENLVRQRCETANAPRGADPPPEADWLHSDPLGSLMPITDLADGVTYANSYCLRCNALSDAAQPRGQRRRLIYWSPVVSCNYNLDSDDRNALYDLISSKGGRALVFSKRHNRWFVRVPNSQSPNDTTSRLTPEAVESEDEPSMDRVCSVSSRAPDAANQAIRHCRPRTVDACPSAGNQRAQTNSTPAARLERARQECQFGHQALVYSHTRNLAYYNPACAECNLEPEFACEPQLGTQLAAPTARPRPPLTQNRHHSASGQFLSGRTNASERLPVDAAPLDPVLEQPEQDGQLDGLEITSGRNQFGLQPYSDDADKASSGSFTVLMDLYGGLQGSDSDDQVGLMHRCEDAERQVYDPFLLTCRDIVCGLSHRFEDGVCVQTGEVASGGQLSLAATDSDQASAAPSHGEVQTPTATGVNGTAAERPSSSGGRPASDRLVVGSAPAAGQEDPEPAGAGQKGERPDRSPDKPASASEPAAQVAPPAGSEADDGNPFVPLLERLKTEQLQPASADARKVFAECGKILIQPEHYRLFGAGELNSSTADSLAAGPAGWQEEKGQTWAVVPLYNLTLAPGQFQPVRVGGRQQPGLLVCSPFKSDLVDKFKPAMVYLTTCCLAVSITSLVLYLLLYCLSTFDLRHWVVELTQAGRIQKDSMEQNALNSPFRESRASAETSYNAVRSQSLSSRGVACLAAALLAAYLLFVLGHHQRRHESGGPGASGGFSGCALIAAATYGSFLLAFNWMFLLSYDIWRTLRLATCHLRAPTVGSQTSRFLTYAAAAALVAFSMASLSLVADQMGLPAAPSDCPLAAHVARAAPAEGQQHAAANNCTTRPAAQAVHGLELFAQTYRPKFGQRAGSCWFSNRRSLAFFFGLPVTLIMLVNLLFFLHSSFMVIKTSSKSSRRLKPTVTTWSQASEQANGDFAHQNSLTTSSISSVQTIQSNLSAESSCYSGGETDQEANQDALEATASIQSQIDAASKQLSGQHCELPPGRKHQPLGTQMKQTSFTDSIASSQISFTEQLLASSLVHKCDLHLSTLGALVSSLAKDYRLYCRLSTIMGLTWLTGLAASLVDQSDALWYLFVVLNSLQGLFIFVAFGLKRSRLTNLKILVVYLDFVLKRKISKKAPTDAR